MGVGHVFIFLWEPNVPIITQNYMALQLIPMRRIPFKKTAALNELFLNTEIKVRVRYWCISI